VRYRVAFAKRFDSNGQESALDPTVEFDALLPEGTIAEKIFVERLEPSSEHGQEVQDEDDAFLASSSPEVWEYEIVDERRSDFEDAIPRAGRILEFEVIDGAGTGSDEVTDEVLEQAEEDWQDQRNAAYDPSRPDRDVTTVGSGVRAGNDGPAGQPTGDPSAGGLNTGKRS